VKKPVPVMPHEARQADFALRRLARMRHQVTLPLASAAAALVRRRAWVDLGYLNEQQFARDLFGWTGKTLRNLAALDEPLRGFPELVSAVIGSDAGPPIGRCAALRIGKVATADTIEMWIERARTCSVRELDALIRNRKRSETAAFSTAAADATVSTQMTRAEAEHGATPPTRATETPRDSAAEAQIDPATDPDVEKVLFRIDLPPEARMAYDEVADLHRAFAGHDAAPACFLEDVLAEVAASGVWAPDPEGSPGRFPPAHGNTSNVASGRSRNAAAHDSDDWPTSTTEGRLATRLLKGFAHDLGDLARIMRQLEAIERGADPERPRDDENATRNGRNRNGTRDGGAKNTAPRGRVSQMLQVVRILRNLVRYENSIEIRMGALLLEQHERRAWPAFACQSQDEYAEQRLGWSSSSARRRANAARALRKVPVVRDAYESGRLNLEQAEWIIRAVRKSTLTKQEQREWVGHTAPVMMKRLRDETRILERNRLEHRADVARSVTLRHGTFAKRVAINVDADASTEPADASGAAAPRRAPTSSPKCFPVPPDDATWLRSLARAPGQGRNRLLDLEGSLLERVLMRGAMLEERAVLRVAEWLARDLLSCLTTLRACVCREVLASRSAAEEARTLLSVRIAAAYLEQKAQVPLWVGLLAALEICVLEWDDPRRKTASSTLQRRVIERDGCRCTAPGCTARRNLQVNHIQERSHGGLDAAWNLHAVCAAHHLHFIHGGRASVRGRAPGNMVWRIGRPEFAQWFVNERRIRSMI
jgi:hypothetical protein